ncbi:hypothetical protein H257_19242 [Aphanomyces astaci]|uniref:Uncharacterized protein n=1 Tax=Aphanomyces astaci TaxID=112090 RepID=W4FAJ1_APHAT|nr:hypothetical protein H257_19242 [Aphanomyces astaci]ETV63826.1 hypothetical protein H257_19242 [Aphanomyces astaci]|eukprot:XP_009846691.1 hypothetical protein H257_19242 [Aphanomyces astaci]
MRLVDLRPCRAAAACELSLPGGDDDDRRYHRGGVHLFQAGSVTMSSGGGVRLVPPRW